MIKHVQWILVLIVVVFTVGLALYSIITKPMSSENRTPLVSTLAELIDLVHPTHGDVATILPASLMEVESSNYIFASYELAEPSDCFRHVQFRGEPKQGSSATASGILIVELHHACYFNITDVAPVLGSERSLEVPYPNSLKALNKVTTYKYPRKQMEVFVDTDSEDSVIGFAVHYDAPPL